jgi:glycerol-3-phosphate dehydrogenase
VWATLRSAISAGAVVANYVEATGLLKRGGSVEGLVARDVLTNEELEFRARTVLNAAGPYAESLLASWGMPLPNPGTYSRDACFVVRRRLLPGRQALALLGQTRDPDARVSRGARHFFLAPWREYTLVGVWHRVQPAGSFDVSVSDDELERFIAEIRQSAPELALCMDDVSQANAGLVPFGENPDGAEDLRYGHRSSLIDHSEIHGCQNLLTLIGLRLTTARLEAERAIDLVFRKRGHRPPSCRTSQTPVAGGEITDSESMLREAEDETAGLVSAAVARSLLGQYGTEYRRPLRQHCTDPCGVIGDSTTIRGQVYQAVREEAARTLGDVVLRRTDLGTGEYPGSAALRECAEIVAEELGWTGQEVETQIGIVAARYPVWERERRDRMVERTGRPAVAVARVQLEG